MLCIIGGYFFLFLVSHFPIYGHHATCPFKLITGIPCPGCGMGRATQAMARGDIIASLHYNLLAIPFTIAISTLLIWMTVDLVRGRETIYPYLTRPAGMPLTVVIIVIIAINWWLNIIHHI
jgi:hypothetical protein